MRQRRTTNRPHAKATRRAATGTQIDATGWRRQRRDRGLVGFLGTCDNNRGAPVAQLGNASADRAAEGTPFALVHCGRGDR